MEEEKQLYEKISGRIRDTLNHLLLFRNMRESEEKFRTIVSSMSDLIFVLDAEDRFVDVHCKSGNSLYIPPQEFLGKRFADVMPPQVNQLYAETVEKVRRMGQTQRFEYSLQIQDETMWSAATLDLHNDGKSIVAGIRNITERKRAKEELSHLRNYLANIIDSMPSVLVGMDPDGQVTQWNTQAQQATGLSPKEAVGQPLAQVFPRLASEMGGRQAMQSREVQRDPKRTYRANEETIYADVTIYPLIAADATAANGVEGVAIRVDDVTERVRMEELLIQSEKMLSVGGLAAGMAHEINNPLAGMMQTAQVMSNRLTSQRSGGIPANLKESAAAGISMDAIRAFMESRDIPRMLAAINESGRRIATIVDNMLSFSRRSDTQRSSHAMAELLNKTVALAATDYDMSKHYDFKTIEIVREYQDPLPYVLCEGAKIQQVFLNILRNGTQAMQEARNKRQEARNKRQEAGNKRQEARKRGRLGAYRD